MLEGGGVTGHRIANRNGLVECIEKTALGIIDWFVERNANNPLGLVFISIGILKQTKVVHTMILGTGNAGLSKCANFWTDDIIKNGRITKIN